MKIQDKFKWQFWLYYFKNFKLGLVARADIILILVAERFIEMF